MSRVCFNQENKVIAEIQILQLIILGISELNSRKCTDYSRHNDGVVMSVIEEVDKTVRIVVRYIERLMMIQL